MKPFKQVKSTCDKTSITFRSVFQYKPVSEVWSFYSQAVVYSNQHIYIYIYSFIVISLSLSVCPEPEPGHIEEQIKEEEQARTAALKEEEEARIAALKEEEEARTAALKEEEDEEARTAARTYSKPTMVKRTG